VNVTVKGRESSSNKFRNVIMKLIKLGDDIKVIKYYLNAWILFYDSEEMNSDRDFELIKYILVICILYYLYTLRQNELFKIISILSPIIRHFDHYNLRVPSTKQWTGHLNTLKGVNNHYEKYQIKLPHAGGNAVKGVGIAKQAKWFYDQLSQLGVFGNIDLSTYKTIDSSQTLIKPLPENITVIYFVKSLNDIMFLGQGDHVTLIPLSVADNTLKKTLINIATGTTIITNDGKDLAKLYVRTGQSRFTIHDIIIREKLIRCGEVNFKAINTSATFMQYNLHETPDMRLAITQLYTVWENQQTLISKYNLKKIVDLENKIIWIAAEMEIIGIGIDRDGMRRYRDSIQSDPSKKKDFDACKRCLPFCTDDDRLHEEIVQLNSITGRFKRKLQYMPKKNSSVRKFICARDGYKFIVADYAQQELRLIASLAKCRSLQQVFLEDKDLYMELAQSVCKDDPTEYRDIFKTIVLGLNYGRGSWSIFEDLIEKDVSITHDDVKSFIGKYNQKFPEIKPWQHQYVKDAQQRGYLSTVMGRCRQISDDDSYPSKINYPVQANAADGFKIALIKVDEKLRNFDAHIVLTVHDEIVVEARKDVADEVAVIVERCMVEAYEELFADTKFAVDVEIRDTWKKDE